MLAGYGKLLKWTRRDYSTSVAAAVISSNSMLYWGFGKEHGVGGVFLAFLGAFACGHDGIKSSYYASDIMIDTRRDIDRSRLSVIYN